MKIRCNCCEERPIIELPEPKNADLVFCKCGKLLASPKEYRGVLSWFIFDMFYDTDHDFTPVEIVK